MIKTSGQNQSRSSLGQVSENQSDRDVHERVSNIKKPLNKVQVIKHSSMLTSPKQVPLEVFHQNHHHDNRKHVHSCIAASKLANNEAIPRFKQHQPHCIHHNQNNGHKQVHQLQHQHIKSNSSEDVPSEAAITRSGKYTAVKCYKQPDKSFLLVEYRPNNADLRSLGKSNSSRPFGKRANQQFADTIDLHNNKRTTIKFISQLYFLLHLSAILSLLLHHKHLHNSDAKLVHLDTSHGGSNRSKKPANDDSLHHHTYESHPANLTASVLNPLPIPQTQSNERELKSNRSLVSHRHHSLLIDRDILVRLIGYGNAKFALQYFLCYMLASSVSILVCLRLIRLFSSARRSSNHEPCAKQQNFDREIYGFYYRSRLDCTPVLIGSISLGLIQLIGIGLDIANNFDTQWTNSGRTSWPTTYLPLLQFAFVSLLLQYILGKVAKKREHKKVVQASESKQRRQDEPQILQTALSINAIGKDRYNRGEVENFNESDNAPASCGLENIALAHLLVTHILLWLMKLNSISLFQVVEQHQSNRVFGNLSSMANLQPSDLVGNFDGSSTRTKALTEKRHRLEESDILRSKWLKSSNFTQTLSPNLQLPVEPHLVFAPTSDDSEKGKRNQRLPAPISETESGLNSVKNERGSRSPNKSIQQVSSTNQSIGSKQIEHTKAATPVDAEKHPNGLTKNQSHLINILNQAAKSQQRFTEQKQQPQANLTDTSLFKSSLPKRMTAFRSQARSPTQTVLSSTTSLPLLSSTDTSARGSNFNNSSSTLVPIDMSDASRHRVRVVISRAEESPFTILESNSIDGENRIRRAKLGPPSRPFPSVESDPAGELATVRSVAQPPTQVSSLNGLDPAPDEEKNSSEPKVGSLLDDNEDEETSNVDESDVELDSLLPSVPNYNETLDDSNNISKNSSNFEEAFAFNEAASAPNVTTLEIKDKLPKSEALVMQQHQHEKARTTTFADYLLPVVQQYHILIIAILFNMWLDGTRKGLTEGVQHSSRADHTVNQLVLRQGHARNLMAIPIRSTFNKHRNKLDPLDLTCISPKTHKNSRWAHGNRILNQRPHSMDSTHQMHEEELSTSSSLSRYNSLRSSSSEQLLWIPSAQLHSGARSPWLGRRLVAPSSHQSITPSLTSSFNQNNQISKTESNREANPSPTHTIWSLLLGLAIVSCSLLVILLGIDLLALLAQCLTQLIAILVCLIGICLSYRSKSKPKDIVPTKHRQYFHYLFLLAAYYCGLASALNLTRLHSPQQLFPIQVVHLLQRQFALKFEPYLFHSLLVLKGLLLVLQVTLQTFLIRASCSKAGHYLRQVYTLLMFANLSLWAMEICEQQRAQPDDFEVHLGTPVDTLTGVASSVVTLSHLYHGLVFMQR